MTQYIGLGGLIVVHEIIELIKPAYANSKFSGLFSIVSSLFIAILLNIGLAVGFGNDIKVAVGVGVATGILASIYHDTTK